MIAARAGEPLDLSPTLRKILEHLLLHQDRVVTRAELCELIWGDPDVDALRGHIHELRRALDRPFEKTVATLEFLDRPRRGEPASRGA